MKQQTLIINDNSCADPLPGHVLKFMTSKRRHHKDFGVICFPEQSYGNSIESPDQFKGNFGLVGRRGYIYQYQNSPQFKYYSQKKYFSIDNSTNEEQVSQIHKNNQQNWLKFHRKKGRLSEFVDKNRVMLSTTITMGDERSHTARQLSNRDRNQRINSLKPQIRYENMSALRPNTRGQYFRQIGKLTGQKMRIRSQRNSLAKTIVPVTARNLKNPQLNPEQKQQVQLKMLMTNKQCNPNKRNQDSYNNYRVQKISRLQQLTKKLQEKQRKDVLDKKQLQKQSQTVQDWYRTTCSSKWVYKKKLDTEQMEQILNNQN